MHTTTSDATICALQRMFMTHGIPDTIVSDNGPQLTSAAFQSFLASLGIRHTLIAPYHLASNGWAERTARSAKNALGHMVFGPWENQINTYLLAQHTTPCPISGKSPAELLMGRRLGTLLDRLHTTYQSDTPPRLRGQTYTFKLGEGVFARNCIGDPKWVPGQIVQVTGPCSYRVRLEDGRQ